MGGPLAVFLDAVIPCSVKPEVFHHWISGCQLYQLLLSSVLKALEGNAVFVSLQVVSPVWVAPVHH